MAYNAFNKIPLAIGSCCINVTDARAQMLIDRRYVIRVKTKHLYNIYTTSAQRHRRWSRIV